MICLKWPQTVMELSSTTTFQTCYVCTLYEIEMFMDILFFWRDYWTNIHNCIHKLIYLYIFTYLYMYACMYLAFTEELQTIILGHSYLSCFPLEFAIIYIIHNYQHVDIDLMREEVIFILGIFCCPLFRIVPGTWFEQYYF